MLTRLITTAVRASSRNKTAKSPALLGREVRAPSARPLQIMPLNLVKARLSNSLQADMDSHLKLRIVVIRLQILRFQGSNRVSRISCYNSIKDKVRLAGNMGNILMVIPTMLVHTIRPT